jgi:hypothetical protein
VTPFCSTPPVLKEKPASSFCWKTLFFLPFPLLFVLSFWPHYVHHPDLQVPLAAVETSRVERRVRIEAVGELVLTARETGQQLCKAVVLYVLHDSASEGLPVLLRQLT